MKTYIPAIIIIIIVALGGYAYMNREVASTPAEETVPVEEQEQVFCTMDAKICPDGSAVGRVGPSCEFAACPGASETTPAAAKTHTVTYTNEGFAPSVVTIKVGDTVTFKNTSSQNFWPASDNHPTHEVYSAFDPKKSIAPGQSWSFTFTQKGSWAYHDHLHARLVGIIVVE